MTIHFSAELSSNHNGSLDRALHLIDLSAAAGFDSVKVQLFEVERLFAPEVLATSEKHRSRKAWELPVEWLPALAEKAHGLGLQFGATCFDMGKVEPAAEVCDFLKISSYDLLRYDLIRACAAAGLLLVLSTGMATQEEIRAARRLVPSYVVEGDSIRRTAGVVVLHCVSKYPTPASESNLSAISHEHSEFEPVHGVSDHSGDPAVVLRAVHRWGAKWVELHVDDGQGVDGGRHCWAVGDLTPAAHAGWLIETVRRGFEADGDGTLPSPGQEHERGWRADPSDGLRPTLAVREEWRARAKP